MTDTRVVGTLSARAITAYERAEEEHRLREEDTRSARDVERQIALSLLIRDSLGSDAHPDDVFVTAGPQTWLNAIVDVDDVTLAGVGYLGVLKLHVLFKCEKCGVLRTSLHEVRDMTSLGACLRRPRSTERCACRPGAESWVTGAVRPS